MTVYACYFYSSYSANDSVVATFSEDTGDAEAMGVADWTGTRNTLPFLNSLTTEGFASATSSSVTVVAGESGRTLLDVVFVASNASITKGASQTQIMQVNRTGASVELDYGNASTTTTLTSSWTGSADSYAVGVELLASSGFSVVLSRLITRI